MIILHNIGFSIHVGCNIQVIYFMLKATEMPAKRNSSKRHLKKTNVGALYCTLGWIGVFLYKKNKVKCVQDILDYLKAIYFRICLLLEDKRKICN